MITIFHNKFHPIPYLIKKHRKKDCMIIYIHESAPLKHELLIIDNTYITGTDASRIADAATSGAFGQIDRKTMQDKGRKAVEKEIANIINNLQKDSGDKLYTCYWCNKHRHKHQGP